MKCNKCGYDDSGSGDMAHVCQRPSFRYGEHPTSFGLFNPKQEPVAWMDEDGDVLSASVVSGKGLRNIPLYTTPPQRTWVNLTAEEIEDIRMEYHVADGVVLTGYERAIEAKLRSKNI